MQNIHTQADLKNAIQELQTQRLLETEALREQLCNTYNSLKPVNLIKHAIHEIAGSNDIKNTVLQTGIGITTGLLSKNLFVGASHSVIKKIVGNVLQFGVANAVASHSSVLKNIGNTLLKFIKK